MRTTLKTSRVLGLAFLLQFVTSFSSGAFLRPAWSVDGDIRATLLRIAANPGLLRATIFLDVLTALGIVFLGACLYLTLRKQGEKMALTALGVYILEATLLAASRAQAFSLLRFAQEYALPGEHSFLLTLGKVAFESMDFVGSTLHMLAFCLGGLLFYGLLYKSGKVPRLLALWGWVTVIPCLLGTGLALFGYEVPFAIYLPYAPFELVIGLWILFKGIQEEQP